MTFVLLSTRRIRWLPVSARKRLPEASNAIRAGLKRRAAVATPPSPP
jgi:hypothetical protein